MAEGNGQSPLTIGEFTRWTQTLDRRLDDYHREVVEIRTTQVAHGESIAVLEASTEKVARSGRTRGIWSAVGGIIGGFIAGLGSGGMR